MIPRWRFSAGRSGARFAITGQDGSYLAELLLKKGYEVHGIKRRTSLFNTDRIDHLYQDPHESDRRFFLHHGDMTDSSSLVRIVQQVQPDGIYSLAAQSHVAVSFEEPEYTANSDALGPLRILESMRILGMEKTTRFYQASTSELNGLVQETPQKESSKLCESYNRQYGTQYACVMPTNLCGRNDSYDLSTSHVLPALIRKAHDAKQSGDKEMTVWGSGRPMREFLYVDDMADACVFLMESNITDGIFNVGTGTDVTIRELAGTVMDAVGLKAKIAFDASKPDGTPRKLLCVDRMRELGWRAKTGLREGIAMAYLDFLSRTSEHK